MLENLLQEVIERRTQDLTYSQLQVSVYLVRDTDGLSLTNQDQGKGFAWQHYLAYSPERAFDPHGRGIVMVTSSFDSIEYRDNGKRVRVKITGSPVHRRPAAVRQCPESLRSGFATFSRPDIHLGAR